MKTMRLGLLVPTIALVAGCGVNLPSEYPLSEYSRQQLLGPSEPDEKLDVPGPVRDQVADYLVDYFGTPEEPGMPGEFASEAEWHNVNEGAALYQTHCIHCHGLSGDGAGPTAPFLFPRPRDYRRGVFKWKSTTAKNKPTREDLIRVLRDGAMGTSMPPFRLLTPGELERLVDYVMFLSKRGEVERKLLLAFVSEGELPDQNGVKDVVIEVVNSWRAAKDQVFTPQTVMPGGSDEGAEYEASLLRGKQLYLGEKAACYKCHNNDGQADEKKMAEEEKKKNVDDWNNKNYPRNLTLGMYRGGRRPVDLYRRIHEGIAGASMPAGGVNLKPNEIWDLVNLVRALPYRPDLLPKDKPAAADHGHGSHGGH